MKLRHLIHQYVSLIHYRKRLCDPDGISVKAAIDGIVKAGILKDDSPEFVEEIIQKQVKSNDEKTEIIIEEVCKWGRKSENWNNT